MKMSFSLLNRAWFAALLLLAFTPALFAAGPLPESRFFPVVKQTRIVDEQPGIDAVSFYVDFIKQRSCEFVDITWYRGNVRVGVAFEPGAELMPKTRPAGSQFAGPWAVIGVDRLEGTTAIVRHRCHPLWITQSKFYP